MSDTTEKVSIFEGKPLAFCPGKLRVQVNKSPVNVLGLTLSLTHVTFGGLSVSSWALSSSSLIGNWYSHPSATINQGPPAPLRLITSSREKTQALVYKSLRVWKNLKTMGEKWLILIFLGFLWERKNSILLFLHMSFLAWILKIFI